MLDEGACCGLHVASSGLHVASSGLRVACSRLQGGEKKAPKGRYMKSGLPDFIERSL
jgi:hypothetical protein